MKYIFLALTVLMVSPTYAAGPVGESYLLPQFRPGETYASVFSISRSVRADGFDELVRRNGGSADYLAIESSAGSWVFAPSIAPTANLRKRRSVTFEKAGGRIAQTARAIAI